MSARREIRAAVVDRYRSAGRADKGRILDELCAVTGWHRKHAVRALAIHVAISPAARRQRRSTYGALITDALVALWEASDRICGKRLRVMIPTLLPSLERHGRLKLNQADRMLLLGVSAATIDRLLVETKIAAGGKRRRVGFYSAVRREVPIRTFNDWHDPPPGFCEVDMVAHGGTSVAGSFIQTFDDGRRRDWLDRMHAAGDARAAWSCERWSAHRICFPGSFGAPISTMTARS